MNLFQEIGLLFKAKNPTEDLIKEVSQVKSGWKTTEFWTAIFVKAFTVFAAIKGFIPVDLAAKIVLISSATYGLYRAIVKSTTGKDLPDLPAA
jgi:hypothetical protein